MTHLILAGFMGTGKSTVGRLLAERLECPFVDCDAEIERIAAKGIPQIFQDEGEEAFRSVESRVLRSLLRNESPTVLALGGGTLASPDNLELIKHAGPLICLSADPVAIYQRVKVQAGQRPLLQVAEPLAKIRELLERRQPAYAQADVDVDTTTLEPVEVVDEVLDWLNRVHVNLGDRSYDIHIEEGCHQWIAQELQGLADPVSTVVIISNRDIDRYYGDAIRASLEKGGFTHQTLLIPPGERYKSLETASRLYGDLIQRKVDRKAMIVALGGGVIGDLAGFVAATYERGIRFLQIPTTLLAQVDSSVGGKVGVNHTLGKNMIGAFLQPQVVLIDPDALKSLPIREIRSGLAEIIKYGVIWDEDFFGYLESNVDNILRLEAQTIKHVIRRSCQIKAHVVEEDE
ncbi:MAG TPA: bifunctional shikimate kinase/3-dehydroquinate synthase, partial [Armatimonadota bacterium]|nr:bifunctional shikimate kinase/3-dehydroquinate synthase [Armatimonadota bacterium]